MEAPTELSIAVPKGRILRPIAELFVEAGVCFPENLDETRKFIVPVPDCRLTFIVAKPADVPTYVEYGAADLGIVGKDVLMEEERDVYELLDLGIGRCRLSVIALPGWKPTVHPRVASKFPNVASRYFRERGQQVEVIRLHGNTELAPLIGLADRIVDLVETGATIRQNGLVEIEKIADITSRLIANRASYRLKNAPIQLLCDRLQEAVRSRALRIGAPAPGGKMTR